MYIKNSKDTSEPEWVAFEVGYACAGALEWFQTKGFSA